MDKPVLAESFWARGRSDTWVAVKSPFGMIIEVGGTAVFGAVTQNGWIAVYFLISILAAIWIVATVSAPYRQRNDERICHAITRNELASLTKQISAKPPRRSLNAEQQGALADAIRQVGVRPDRIDVGYCTIESECADFASDIAEAIKMADIESDAGNMFEEPNPRDRGIKIYVGKTKTLEHLGNEIHETFVGFGFQPERRAHEKPDEITIVVTRAAEEK